MIAVLPEIAKRTGIAVLGFHIPDGIPHIGLGRFGMLCWRGPWRIWHARRNVDMLVGLILRHIFRFRLMLLFTSAAQRSHSWITRFYYRRMDAVIATTSKAASFLERSAVVIPHGVDPDRFSPPSDRASAWAARGLPGIRGIGIFGRVRPQKGTEEFVEAMIRVLPQRPGWTAVIVGQTTAEFQPFERRLRERVRSAGLENRVCFVGFLKDPADVPGWFQSVSIVVCASRREGFGLSCLEAMASGCPVVATRAGAWPELITEGEDGYLVPPGDSAALAEALLKITTDSNVLLKMAEKARQKVLSRYQIAAEADGICSVYRELFSRHADSVKL